MSDTRARRAGLIVEAITDAETRLSEQIAVLLELSERGQSMTEAETLVAACEHHLDFLRKMQADLLRKGELSCGQSGCAGQDLP